MHIPCSSGHWFQFKLHAAVYVVCTWGQDSESLLLADNLWCHGALHCCYKLSPPTFHISTFGSTKKPSLHHACSYSWMTIKQNEEQEYLFQLCMYSIKHNFQCIFRCWNSSEVYFQGRNNLGLEMSYFNMSVSVSLIVEKFIWLLAGFLQLY